MPCGWRECVAENGYIQGYCVVGGIGVRPRRFMERVTAHTKSTRGGHAGSTPAMVFGFWFLVCYAATQIATQLRQRCIQEVCSNKEAWKRLNESNGTSAMDLGPMKLY